MSDNSFVLVDGSYYLFRAYHAMPNLTNSSSEPTGAIYGVINMLRKLIKEQKPNYFAVVFDAKGKSFRNDIYPEYKAHRPPTPEDLSCQIEPLHEIIRALGIPLLAIDNVEADDVLGTLAKQAEAEGMETLISTGDKDMAQIVNDNIHLINTMSNTTLDPAGVVEKYGVPPERIIDYLALIGDTADNVPGIPKVGPKTAAKWLSAYGSLDAIIEKAEEISGKVGESLRANLEQLPLSKELVTLKCDVELDFTPSDLVRGEPDHAVLEDHYQRWGFRSWLSDTHKNNSQNNKPVNTPLSPPAQEQKAERYETLLSQSQLDSWLKELKKSELFAFDTETTSLDYMAAEIVGLSFATKAGSAAYVPLAHDYPDAPKQLDRDTVLQQFLPLLESEKILKLGQNLKYDKSVLANHGIELKGIEHDSMLQSYVLDSTASRHDMDSLARKYLDIETIHYEDIAGKGAKQLTFNQIPIETAAPYAAEDADITLQLHETFWPKLSKNKELKKLYEEIEVPLLSVLSRVERNGVIIDTGMLQKQSEELTKRMEELERESHEVAGQSFNMGSPKQIQAILYEKMELPVLAKTPKGQPSTAESVLQELAHDYELPQLILEHRGLSKLKSTYTDKLPEQINPKTGRIHTSYHQAVAATGRLSSSDPNLQNIPIRNEEGRRIRQAFIAPEGHVLLAADYSQIELRIMAHLSGDENLLKAFANDEDIHQATAAEVFECELKDVSSEQRRAAKAINFGLIYGMSAFGLAKQLGIERSAARDYVERYFNRYPAVKDYMDNIRASAKELGYVETVFKRRLYLPEIDSRNTARRQYAERTAINAPMQGTAADIIKRAMISIDRKLTNDFPDIKMIMQVHDELVFEVPEKQVDDIKKEIGDLMVHAAELSVPLTVGMDTGLNWDEAH